MTHMPCIMRPTIALAALLCLAIPALAIPALVTLALVTPALAQQPPQAPTNCTDVQVGSAQSYDCINAQLGAVARNTQRFSSDTNAPVTSSSPSNVVGTYNQSATANRLGRNFGKSVTPYRPAYTPPPVLGAPR